MNVKELHLFLVRNDSLSYPVFYVQAFDILEATRIAKELVTVINNDRVVGAISMVATPLLQLEDE